MNQQQWTEVDRYITNLFAPPDSALTGALEDSAAAGLPGINVAPNQGKLLEVLARAVRARRILEIGTLGGYSTIWLGRALPPEGRLLTLEINGKHAEVARSNLARAGLISKVELRIGDARESLKKLVAEGPEPFDLIFIDADKESYPDYLQGSLRLSRPGTLIIADNVVRRGAVADANSTDPLVLGARRFNEMLAADPRLSATAVQTVGQKGYDGLAVAVVLESPAR
jgi:predicted O-methyltransferase YrrM